MKPSQIIVSRSDIAGPARGAGMGPDALRIASYNNGNSIFHRYPIHEMPCINTDIPSVSPFKNGKYIDHLHCTLSRTMKQSCRIFQNTDASLLLSGDHSNAAGLLSGCCQASPEEKTGVIWIDAHADLHTPYTSPSGNMHGMPLSIALGLNNLPYKSNTPAPEEERLWESLTKLNKNNGKSLLSPEDIAFIDVRDMEEQEEALIRDNNIFHRTPEDRKSKGIEQVLNEALTHLSHCDRLYVSFDVDSLDSSIVQGTGTPVENGLKRKDAVYLIYSLLNDSRLKALEITEINPLLDEKNNVADLITGILDESLLCG